ncbi:hypothetical protein [Halobaculum marinum]|uniref:Uncharacterized protein n=1 Tax=Halobaculum marinum TaxID=3031996 RepID=A0ABD5WZ66_9EURY|nr:hypothetical protein [Halobaculum sp. DT55]
MPSDRSLVRVVPGPLVPVAIRVRSAVDRLLPDDPLPIARIVRYAVLAMGVYALGLVTAGVVYAAFDLFTDLFYAVPGDVFGRAWADLTTLVRDAVEAFALLVALGVFLTQFERDD